MKIPGIRFLWGLVYKRQHQRVFVQEIPLRMEPLVDPHLQITRQNLGDAVPEPVRAIMRVAGTWDAKEFERRRKLGDACFLAYEGNLCVHYAWMTRAMRDITSIGYRTELLPAHAWIYDCYTLPIRRGQAIYPRVLAQILGEASREDARYVWIDVGGKNTASVRGILKAGFKEMGTLQKSVLFSAWTLFRRIFVTDSDFAELLNRMPSRWA